MALPWHKLNHKKQNHYILLVTIALAFVVISVAFLITHA